MRGAVIAWLQPLGLPAWLVPDYFCLAGIAALWGIVIALRLAREDGADLRIQAEALGLAYAGALAGGYVFESLRAIPTALQEGSPWPLVQVGRAAYGGVLGAIAASSLYLRWRRVAIAPFLDRAAIGLGISLCLVRTGCFLAGCDYGVPTRHAWGVRFPAGSAAAVDHARLGLVAPGAASLPVHPTELYEAALGLLIVIFAWLRLRRGDRDGRTFLWALSVYAIGRGVIEFLRGDADRGLYLGFSPAQYTSLLLCVTTMPLLFMTWRQGRRAAQAAHQRNA